MTREEAVKILRGGEIVATTCDIKDYTEAREMSIKALDKCDKIQQIISDWDNAPWGTSRTVMQATLLKIEDVLEKEKESEE